MATLDEPIAISRAINSMIKSVERNNNTLKSVNKDLIVSLGGLKTTIEKAFSGIRDDNKKAEASAGVKYKTSTNYGLIMNGIYAELQMQTKVLSKKLDGLPFLTSATAIHETDLYRKTVTDLLRAIANSGGLGGFGRGGLPGINPANAVKKTAVTEAENVAEGIGEGAAGAEGLELATNPAARKAEAGLLRRLLASAGRIPGIGMLGGGLKLAGGLGGAALGVYSASNISSSDQSKPFFGGSQGIVGSTAMNYAGSIAGDVMAGATIGGPWGALIGGGVGLGSALYQEFSPQINNFLGTTYTKIKSVMGGTIDWISKNLPSWDTIKNDINNIGFNFGAGIKAIKGWIGDAGASINKWFSTNLPDFTKTVNVMQSELLNPKGGYGQLFKTIEGKLESYVSGVGDWASKNIPGWKDVMSHMDTTGKTKIPGYKPKPTDEIGDDYNPNLNLAKSVGELVGVLKKWFLGSKLDPSKPDPEFSRTAFMSNGIGSFGGASIVQAAYMPGGYGGGYHTFVPDSAAIVGGSDSYTGNGSATGKLSAKQLAVRSQIYNDFIARGYSPSEAAGMVGAAGAESNYIPGNTNNANVASGGSAAHGLFQWLMGPGDRGQEFKDKYGIDPAKANVHQQTAFAAFELSTKYKKVKNMMDAINNRTDISDAEKARLEGVLIEHSFEGPNSTPTDRHAGRLAADSFNAINNVAPGVATQPVLANAQPSTKLDAGRTKPSEPTVATSPVLPSTYKQVSYQNNSAPPALHEVPMYINSQGLILVNSGVVA